ncbi:MAG TPA: SRPBCC domain-containing protein [Actinomycetota bacterium]|jgi:hypothetical protein
MKELDETIEVRATPQEVWAVLMDVESYGEWNPFLQIEGDLRVGARLSVQISPVGERAMTIRPTVTMVKDGHELRWLGRLLMHGIFNGEHIFRIEEIDPGRVRFVQHERFTGVLVPFLWKRLRDGGTRKGFTAMNEALAARVVERRVAGAR